jgi:hypothetical protein
MAGVQAPGRGFLDPSEAETHARAEDVDLVARLVLRADHDELAVVGEFDGSTSVHGDSAVDLRNRRPGSQARFERALMTELRTRSNKE